MMFEVKRLIKERMEVMNVEGRGRKDELCLFGSIEVELELWVCDCVWHGNKVQDGTLIRFY